MLQAMIFVSRSATVGQVEKGLGHTLKLLRLVTSIQTFSRQGATLAFMWSQVQDIFGAAVLMHVSYQITIRSLDSFRDDKQSILRFKKDLQDA